MKLKIRGSQPDFWLLLSIIILLGLGTMMVFSASTASSYSMSDQSTSYDILIKQFIFAILGIGLMFFMSFVDYKLIGKFTLLIYAGSIGLLGLVPLIGVIHNGARRWLNFGIEFQPSEIFKIAVVLFLAYVFSTPKIREKAVTLWGILIYMAPVGVGLLLLILQPHVSCIIIIGCVMLVMMFIGGVKPATFILMFGLAAALVIIVFTQDQFSYIVERVFAFRNPEADPSGDGYQIMQSLYAIGSGGLFGRGLGQGVQKYLYLPEPYNDFILSILAEELGFFGVFIVIALFAVFVWRGYKISICAPDKFSSLVACGITTIIAVQATMNIAVVTSSMPVTGISLPFFSYGGTSLSIMMASMGILLNISKQSKYAKF